MSAWVGNGHLPDTFEGNFPEGVAAVTRPIGRLLLLNTAFLTTGCTRELDVSVSIADQKVQLGFHHSDGLFGPKRLGACIIGLEIFDEKTNERAWALDATGAHCRDATSIVVGSVPPGFHLVPSNGQLVSGREYYASAVAEEGVGRSDSWIAP